MQSPFERAADPLATVRTEDNQRGKSNLLPTLDNRTNETAAVRELSSHDKKEAEIYQTMANMPSRRIHLVE